MIAYITTSTLRDFLRFGRIAAWILTAIVVGILSKLILNDLPESSPTDRYSMLSGIFTYHVLALAGAIFSALVISAEVEQKTIVYLLTRPIPRSVLLIGRMLAAVVATFLCTLFTAIAVSLVVRGVGPTSGAFLRDLVALSVGSAAYIAFFVMLSLMINRAMIVCLLYAFAWEIAVPNMPGSIYYLSINSYISAIGQRAGAVSAPLLKVLSGESSNPDMPLSRAWMVLTGLIVVLTFAAAWWFTRFEFVPREDTE